MYLKIKADFEMNDTDKDGKISKDEFAVKVKNKFTKADKNKDGKLEKSECPGFDKHNKDGNDFVSEDELKAGCAVKFAKIDADNQQGASTYSIIWDSPPSGRYELYLKIILNDGKLRFSKKVPVVIR